MGADAPGPSGKADDSAAPAKPGGPTKPELNAPGGAETAPGASNPAPGGASMGMPPVTMGNANTAGPMPIARLTNDEYSNTIRDLLVDPSQPGRALPPDSEGASGYSLAPKMDVRLVRAYQQAAETLAPVAVAKLGMLFSCDAGSTRDKEDACADRFIKEFGKRAYRRPLVDLEITQLRDVYTIARNDLKYPYTDGIRLVLQTVLQSLSFLYHWEIGARPAKKEGLVIRLNDWEVASRLSYFLWGTLPDAGLFAAAEAGKLADATEVQRQAQRMVADKKARYTTANFHNQWLLIDDVRSVQKDPTVYTTWSSDVGDAMAAETEADDIGLLWQKPETSVAAAAVLTTSIAGTNPANIDKVMPGTELISMFDNPATDSRVPDVVVLPKAGTV